MSFPELLRVPVESSMPLVHFITHDTCAPGFATLGPCIMCMTVHSYGLYCMSKQSLWQCTLLQKRSYARACACSCFACKQFRMPF